MTPEQDSRNADMLVRIARARLVNQIRSQKHFINKHEQELALLPRRIAELEQQLSAIDMTFSLHAIQVDPQQIRGKITRRRTRPNGTMLRVGLRFVRLAGEAKFSSSELATHLERNNAIVVGEFDGTVWHRTRRFLLYLQRAGVVEELVGADGQGMDIWRAVARSAQGTNITSPLR